MHFQSISQKIAVNLITGALGAGKTTLLRQLLAQKPQDETWILLVNELGAVGIDGAILSESGQASVELIPGGCICCTALAELKTTLQTIVSSHAPDRLLIEPTGLGEPDSLVDLLQSELFSQHFDIQTAFAVFDSATTSVTEFNDYIIMQNLAHMADVLVFNKQELASEAQKLALRQYAQEIYPPKQTILFTEQGKIDISLLSLVSQHQTTHTIFIKKAPPLIATPQINSLTACATLNTPPALPYSAQPLNHLSERRYQHTLNHHTIGWIFEPSQIFDWAKLHALFQSLNQSPGLVGVQRAKGVLRVGAPWMLFQWVNQQTSREYIAYRRDSRIELLIQQDSVFDFIFFEQQLAKCMR